MAIKIKSNYKSLKDKKEKKLNIDYKKIEKIIEEFLAKYDIDTKIEQFIFEDLGFNFEPSELSASFGLVQLKKLKKFREKRIAFAKK